MLRQSRWIIFFNTTNPLFAPFASNCTSALNGTNSSVIHFAPRGLLGSLPAVAMPDAISLPLSSKMATGNDPSKNQKPRASPATTRGLATLSLGRGTARRMRPRFSSSLPMSCVNVFPSLETHIAGYDSRIALPARTHSPKRGDGRESSFLLLFNSLDNGAANSRNNKHAEQNEKNRAFGYHIRQYTVFHFELRNAKIQHLLTNRKSNTNPRPWIGVTFDIMGGRLFCMLPTSYFCAL